MTLILKKPTGAKLAMRKSWQPMDTDAAAYITAVETADGQALEEKTKIAIDNFVLGCKADGIWTAIKASCILAGARTLDGALVPLVGAAPTNFNFVAGDYNRKTGLLGNGTTKYLSTGFAENSVPQNSIHLAAYATTSFGNSKFMIAGVDNGSVCNLYKGSVGAFASYLRGGNAGISGAATITTGFFGSSRPSSTTINVRYSGVNASAGSTSNASNATTLDVFRSQTYPTQYYGNGRLAFYSIGESLNLALLDARVTDLINAIGAAIP